MENAQPVQTAPTYSTLAIFALIFAVLAWTVLPVMGLALSSLNIMNFVAMPLAGSVIASICGWTAQRKIRTSEGTLRGAGLAKAARVMAYTQYALFALLFVFATLQIFLSQRNVYIH